MRFSRPLALCAMVTLSVACATTRDEGWNRQFETQAVTDREALLTEANHHWQKRHVKEELLTALEKFEKLAASDVDDYEARVHLSRGYYLLADAHETELDLQKKFWETGITWGEQAMATNPEFGQLVQSGKDVGEAAEVLDSNHIEAMYWTAVNLGKWGRASGIATILKYRGRVVSLINRVEALEPEFFYGAVNRYWGAYYAVAPSFAGGSLETSRVNFEKSFEQANDYLGSHVLFAEIYAVKKGDEQLFRERLNAVLVADPRVIPEIEPEQILEQEKAKRLLNEMNRLF